MVLGQRQRGEAMQDFDRELGKLNRLFGVPGQVMGT